MLSPGLFNLRAVGGTHPERGQLPRQLAERLLVPAIADLLATDAEFSSIVAAEASEVLRPSDHSHVAVLQSLHLLRGRLATRARELRATTDAIDADLSLARLGLLP